VTPGELSSGSGAVVLTQPQPMECGDCSPSSMPDRRGGTRVNWRVDHASAPAAPDLQGVLVSRAADHPPTPLEAKAGVRGWSAAHQDQRRQDGRSGGGSQWREEQQQASRENEGTEEKNNNNRDGWGTREKWDESAEREGAMIGRSEARRGGEQGTQVERRGAGEQQSNGISVVGAGRGRSVSGSWGGRARRQAMSAGDGLGTPLYRWLYG
jgi:hypothetical protein